MTGRVLYYHNADATSVSFSIVRVDDGYIWDTVEEDFVAPADATWANALVTATSIDALGAWDVELPDVGITKGYYQVAVYADPSGVPFDPDMGVVTYLQPGGSITIINIK